MTIVTTGDDRIIEQIDKQVSKLIDVIKVTDLTSAGNFIERELLLLKVRANSKTRSQIIELVEIFEGKIVCVGKDEIGIELSGRDDKISDFIELMKPFQITEMARTGKAAIAKS